MTTSCISPTFLCKVTSLQKIGVPADLFLKNRKSPRCDIFSPSDHKHSGVCVQHGYISSGGTVGEGFFTVSRSWRSFRASDRVRSITKPSRDPLSCMHRQRWQPMVRFTRPQFISAPPPTGLTEIESKWRLKLDQCIWQPDHKNCNQIIHLTSAINSSESQPGADLCSSQHFTVCEVKKNNNQFKKQFVIT